MALHEEVDLGGLSEEDSVLVPAVERSAAKAHRPLNKSSTGAKSELLSDSDPSRAGSLDPALIKLCDNLVRAQEYLTQAVTKTSKLGVRIDLLEQQVSVLYAEVLREAQPSPSASVESV